MTASKITLSVMSLVMLILSIVPFFEPIQHFKPFWVLLFLIYLIATFPKQISVTFICFLGLMLDALTVGLLGLQSFALLLAIYVTEKHITRLRLLSLPQQLLGIATLSSIYQITTLSIQKILGYPVTLTALILPIMMSTLCWPWLQYVCDSIFFRYTKRI